jgi:hypothetical protein
MYLQSGEYHYNDDKENGKNKPGFLTKLALVFAFVFGSLASFAQEVAKTQCVRLKVKPTVDHKVTEGVTMRLYKNEQEVTRIDSTDEKQETFVLDKDAYYTVEISYPGREMRRVGLSTALPPDVSPWPMFRYEMTVELPATSPVKNDFYQDFPVALIEYDPNKDKFDYSKRYTAHIKQKMNEIKVESIIVNK